MGELAQPLEISDFSGGITENIVGADPRRYEIADNWLIQNDKSLRVRAPFVPLSNGSGAAFPTGQQRLTSMFSWLNETTLVGQSERSFYWYNPTGTTWTQIAGVASNPVLSGASIYAQTSFAEFQKQVLVTSDGGIDPYGSFPAIMYQTTQNNWTARTAGLPRAYAAGNYTYQTLLNRCIVIANAIRASMILHFSDAVNTTYLTPLASSQVSYIPGYETDQLHLNADQIALSYFQSVTFLPGEPTAGKNAGSVVPAATDVTTLYALVGALNSAYALHSNDALIGSYNENPRATGTLIQADYTNGYSHLPVTYSAGLPVVKGPLVTLTNTVTPTVPTTVVGNATLDATKLTSLIAVAAQLDDLNLKWYWHQLAINTHDPANQFTKINKYLADQADVGLVLPGNGSPVITPDYTDFINYVNNLVTIFSGHIGVDGPHTQQANAIVELLNGGGHNWTRNDPNIYLPVATDLKSAYLLVYWLRAQYFIHFTDASAVDFSTFTCGATTAGSASIPTPVFPTSGTVGKVGQWVFNSRIDTGGVFDLINNSNINTRTYGVETLAAQIITIAANWTVDRTFTNSGFTKNFQVSSSKYHSYNVGGVLGSTTTVQTTSDETLASSPTAVGTSLSTWGDLALELFSALANHAFNGSIHASNSDLSATLPAVPVYQVNAQYMWDTYSIQPCSPAFFQPGIATYSWAFVFSYTYTVYPGNIQYTVKSNPVYSSSIDGPTPLPVGATIATSSVALYPSINNAATHGYAITGLPALSNTSETNYDLTNVQLEVYRTTDGGTTYTLNKTLNYGTTNYTDTANDSVQVGTFGAQGNQTPLYTTGGVVGSDQPPKSKFIHILNGTTYYAGIFESGEFFPARVRQAVQLAPEWVPASFNDDVDDDITGISSTKDNVIVGCKNSVYRLSGGFTQSGQGLITHERIADTLGFLNQKSVVKTEVGVFFAGTDGFYYTDGYQLIKISLELDRTYQGLTQTTAQQQAIYGAYDKTTRRVWWALRASPYDTDNSVFYVFYLNYGIKPSGVFTTASNYPYLRPSSLVFQQGTLYMGHELGYVLNMDENQKQDYVVSTSVSPTLWSRVIIPYDYTSGAISMGTTFKRKWFTKLHYVGGNVGNAAIQISVIRDMNFDNTGAVDMKPINYNDNCVWGTPTCVWGDDTQVWNNKGKIDTWRRFPQTALRGDFVQIKITPATVAVYASSVNYPAGANVVVDATAKTATIQTPASYTSIKFMPDVVGYVIAFQSDAYVTEYAITALDATSKIITYSDTANASVSGTVGWVIRGQKKEQRAELNSYLIHYMFLGDKVQRYPGNASNAGVGNGGENPS